MNHVLFTTRSPSNDPKPALKVLHGAGLDIFTSSTGQMPSTRDSGDALPCHTGDFTRECADRTAEANVRNILDHLDSKGD